ncbi:oligoribonuclease [Buchnera aphidicola (Chaitoregma tattakana)]|uniref:oligoribonuclease n=1 Tax=Buchnera aphidicola TaxID=9 RepID=UPI0031B83CBD
MNKNKLIWIDLEMTGLDPEKDFILEIGIIITDKQLKETKSQISIPIYQKPKILNKMNEWSKKIHKKNGLIKKSKNSKYNEALAERKIIKFIKKTVEKKQSPMCGSSNFIDKLFLKKFMPDLLDYFHYRSIDVSSIKELSKIWNKNVYKKFKKHKNHTVIEDIKNSIRELIHYKKHFLKCD